MPDRVIVLLSAAVLVFASAAVAQTPLVTHTLTGSVTDQAGRMLPGVTVDLTLPADSNSVRTVVTDGTGTYRIDRVLPGVYVLTFRLPGFAPAIRDIEVGGGASTFSYDVQLTPGAARGFAMRAPGSPPTRVVCGMTMITPAPGFDRGIVLPRTTPPGAQPVKPSMRIIQPTLCWEPSTDSPQVPPSR